LRFLYGILGGAKVQLRKHYKAYQSIPQIHSLERWQCIHYFWKIFCDDFPIRAK